MGKKNASRLLLVLLVSACILALPASADEIQERLSRNLYSYFFRPEPLAVRPSLKGYHLPLGQTAFLESASALSALGDPGVAALRKNGFVISPALSSPSVGGWLDAAEKRGAPLLVTVDLVAWLAWRVMGRLRETRTSEDNLRGLEHLAAAVLDRLASQENALVEKNGIKGRACRLARRYFSVLICLLAGSGDACDEVAARELALIRAAEKPAPSPLFGYRMDYSLFALPEGTDPASREARAFLALRWLQTPSFVLPDAPQVGNGVTREQARVQTVAASLISVFLFQSTWYPYFHRFYQLGSIISGISPVLTTYDYMEPLESVVGFCGDPLPLADDTVLARFVDSLRSRKPLEPHSFFVLPRERPPEGDESPAFFAAPHAMHLEPPRRILADAVCTRLLYPFVGKFVGSGDPPTGKPARLYPTPWDLVMLLGHRSAERWLRAEKITNYRNYKAEFERIRSFFARLDERARNCSFETGWLFSLQRLAGKVPSGSQPFQEIQAWELRRALSMLSNWYMLSAVTRAPAPSGGVRSRPYTFPAVFVEPEYGWYCAMLQNLRALVLSLRSLGVRLPEAETLLRFVEGCRDLAAAELTGGRPSPAAEKFSREAGRMLAALVGDGALPSPLVFRPPVEGVGKVEIAVARPCLTLAVAADAGAGRARVFLGPCFFVRTRVVPSSETGSAARDMEARPAADIPRWLRSLLVSAPAQTP